MAAVFTLAIATALNSFAALESSMYESTSKSGYTLCPYRSVALDGSNILQRASLVGTDDREIISKNPKSEEAKLANRIGSIFVRVGNHDVGAGTGQLVRWNGAVYLVASGHGFYDLNGKPHFDEGQGIWHPNTHYYGFDDVVAAKEYQFDLNPLNLDFLQVRRANPLNDIAIFRIRQSVATDKVFSYERGATSLSAKTDEQLLAMFDTGTVEGNLIAEHVNFHDTMEVGLSRNCKIRPPVGETFGDQMLHDCDTGGNSSGAGIYVREDEQYVLIGIHVAGRSEKSGGDFAQGDFDLGVDGNRFIPAEAIRAHFQKLESEGIIP